jgi:hypothetical protein
VVTRWGSEPRTSSTSAGRRRLIQHLARLRRLVQQLRRRPKLDRLDQPGVWMPRNRADAARMRHGAVGAGGPLSAKASLRGSDTRERLKDFRSVPNTVVSRVAAGPDEQHERRLLVGRRFERRADADELFGASTRTPAFAPRSESGRAERATCSARKVGRHAPALTRVRAPELSVGARLLRTISERAVRARADDRNYR